MRPSKAHFVTSCQQLLALGAVLAVLTPAASVVSLDVVQHARVLGRRRPGPGAGPGPAGAGLPAPPARTAGSLPRRRSRSPRWSRSSTRSR